jgi:hypothetical protein
MSDTTVIQATPGSVGVGQQDFSDGAGHFNSMSFLVDQKISRLNSMKPVKIVAVHGGIANGSKNTGTVDVQPLVNQLDGQGNSVPHGIIYGLPWGRSISGGWGVISDPVVGDTGVIVVSDRDMSSLVSNSGAQSNPGSYRQYDLADSIYMGGFLQSNFAQGIIFNYDQSGGLQFTDANGNTVNLTKNGVAVSDKFGNKITTTTNGMTVQDKNSNVVTMAAAGMTINAASGALTVEDSNGNTLVSSGAGWTMTGNLKVNGTIIATGNVTGGSIDLETHTHTGVTTGSGNTGPPTG